jgi:hypothetical protein
VYLYTLAASSSLVTYPLPDCLHIVFGPAPRLCVVHRSTRLAKCRGWTTMGQTPLPAVENTTQWDMLTAGFQHTCGIVSGDGQGLTLGIRGVYSLKGGIGV